MAKPPLTQFIRNEASMHNDIGRVLITGDIEHRQGTTQSDVLYAVQSFLFHHYRGNVLANSRTSVQFLGEGPDTAAFGLVLTQELPSRDL
jgi:hypothetical protein